MNGSPAQAVQHSIPHPFASLSAAEITATAALIKGLYNSDVELRFKALTLQEPPKKDVLGFLRAEHDGQSTPELTRRAFVSYYLRNTVSPTRWR